MKQAERMLPLLYGSSWLGNLLLTVLACFLVFGQSSPLTPGVFAAAAICLLSGNLLPLGVYGLQLKLSRLQVEAEAQETEASVRHALKRAEEVAHRLDETEGALSKGLLLARQLPQQVRKGMEDWEAMRGFLREMEVESLNESLFRVSKQMREFRDRLDLGLEKLQTVSDMAAAGEGGPADGGEGGPVGSQEQFDMLYEALEGLQAGLDDLSVRLATMERGQKKSRGRSGKKEGGSDREQEELAPSSPQTEFSLEGVEGASEPEEAGEAGSVMEREEEAASAVDEEPGGAGAVLRVEALIGIANQLYVRGSGAGLSWEKGTLLEAVGIGQFERKFPVLEEMLEVQLYLNDAEADPAGVYQLHPGAEVTLHPKFGESGEAE